MNEQITRFSHDCEKGLSLTQVNERKEQKLVNVSKKVVGKSYVRIIYDNLFSFFNVLLYIIAGLMIWAEHYDGLLFLGVLGLNIIIGLYEDISARRLMDKLHVLNAPKSKVIRESGVSSIPYDEIVLDDIIVLESNDQISADCVLLDGKISVNESLLTGESTNVLKTIGDTIYAGSYVTSGKALCYADKVGKDTYLDSIQSSAKKFKRSKSEILKSLKRIFRIIGIIVIFLAALTVIIYAVQNRFTSAENIKKLIGSISGSLVGMIPSGLYLLTSTALAVGVIALNRRKAHVQDFYSIEMLARANTLCVDKTGTITDGTMSVHNVITFGKYKENDVKNAVSDIINACVSHNSTSNALINFCKDPSFRKADKVLEFTSENKYSGASFGKETFIMGAPEFLNIKNKEEIDEHILSFTSKGYRVVVVGKSSDKLGEKDFKGALEVMGIVVLQDHIKDDAVETFRWFTENNVDIKVISGDNAITVSEIAKQVGIKNADKFISLEGLSLDEVRSAALEYTVFGRVTPEQKAVIVEELQKYDRTVAMTGDGVNDILALKKADCSIAMASGAEAAKNVSHIVLMNSNFSSLPDVVGEGRRVVNNLQRTCSLFLVKTMFAMITTFVFLMISLGTHDVNITYPFLTNHMYMWEILNLGMAAFFLALERNNEIIKGGFIKNILKKAIPAGITILVAVFMIFGCWWLTKYGGIYTGIVNYEAAISMAVLSFTVISNVVLLSICRPFDKYRLIVYLCATVITVVLLVVFGVVSYSSNSPAPLVRISFNLLSPQNYITIMVCTVIPVAIYVFVRYIVKIWRDKNYDIDDKEEPEDESKNK